MLIAVSKGKPLGEAAHALGLTEARALQIIRALEVEIGRTLFEVSADGPTPTKACAAFLPYAEEMLAIRLQGLEAVRAPGTDAPEILNIGTSQATGIFLMTQLAANFMERYPDIRVQLSRAHAAFLRAGLEDHIFDACICFRPPRVTPLRWTPLFRSEMVGIRSISQGPLDGRTSLSDFAQQPLVLPSRACSYRLALNSKLKKLGIRPRIRMQIDDARSLVEVVRLGLGSAIVPRTLLRNQRGLAVTNLVNPRVFVEAGVLTRQSLSVPIAALIEIAQEKVFEQSLAEKATRNS